MKNKPIVIICGDPESTFNEILIKTFKSKAFRNFKFPIIIICSEKLFQNELKKLKTKINLQKFENKNKLFKNKIYIVDIPLKKGNLSLLKKNEYIKKSFDVGLNLSKKNNNPLFVLLRASSVQQCVCRRSLRRELDRRYRRRCRSHGSRLYLKKRRDHG